MKTSNHENAAGPMVATGDSAFVNRYFCKLFDDMIIRELCLLRRRELNERDQFCCTGCSKDTMFRGSRSFAAPPMTQ